MSNFTRKIQNLSELTCQLNQNLFLQKIDNEFLQKGTSFLAFRNTNATIYYNGNQLCDLLETANFAPTVYNQYLPIVRSKVLDPKTMQKKENYSEKEWLNVIGLTEKTFADVFPEIISNIEKDSSPEGIQASFFYKFSPLNKTQPHEIVLLDIEAAFSESGEKTDKIDLVFYHTGERRLMFAEVKRLRDNRWTKKDGSEVLHQMGRYRKRIMREQAEINAQYNNVIDYYNRMSHISMPYIDEHSSPKLGLLLVEFTRSERDSKEKRRILELCKNKSFKVYDIGTAKNSDNATLSAIYKKFT